MKRMRIEVDIRDSITREHLDRWYDVTCVPHKGDKWTSLSSGATYEIVDVTWRRLHNDHDINVTISVKRPL